PGPSANCSTPRARGSGCRRRGASWSTAPNCAKRQTWPGNSKNSGGWWRRDGNVASNLRRERARLRQIVDSQPAPADKDPGAYPAAPVGYARDVLGVTLTPGQAEIARALLVPPHRVMAVSANNQGKTLLSGVLVNWFFDNFEPGICVTTAPEYRSVKDTCWK